MSTAAKVGAVLATTAGAGLVAALLLPWWDLPPALLDPPADLPEGLSLLAEGLQRTGDLSIEHDAFSFFALRDIVWLATGLAGFALGLTALLGSRVTRPLAYLVVGLALVSTVLIVLSLISPPDYADVTADMLGRDPFPGLDYDLPFGREAGPWVALVASVGVLAGALLTLRERAR